MDTNLKSTRPYQAIADARESRGAIPILDPEAFYRADGIRCHLPRESGTGRVLAYERCGLVFTKGISASGSKSSGLTPKYLMLDDRVGEKIDVLWPSRMRKLRSLASIFQLIRYERRSILID